MLLVRDLQCLPQLLVGVSSVLLSFFGQSLLSDFALVLSSLGEVLQQLCLLTLEGDSRTVRLLYRCFFTEQIFFFVMSFNKVCLRGMLIKIYQVSPL